MPKAGDNVDAEMKRSTHAIELHPHTAKANGRRGESATRPCENTVPMARAESAPLKRKHHMAQVDIELFTFVERFATNLLRWDLLLHFGRAPDTSWTADEIARCLRRSLASIIKELDDLTYLRVLVRHYTPERTTYRLTRRSPLRRAVLRLADLSREVPAEFPSRTTPPVGSGRV